HVFDQRKVDIQLVVAAFIFLRMQELSVFVIKFELADVDGVARRPEGFAIAENRHAANLHIGGKLDLNPRRLLEGSGVAASRKPACFLVTVKGTRCRPTGPEGAGGEL